MSDIVKSSLTALIAGERPSPSAIQACFTAIMDGDVGEAQMAAFLIALKMRGEQQQQQQQRTANATNPLPLPAVPSAPICLRLSRALPA